MSSKDYRSCSDEELMAAFVSQRENGIFAVLYKRYFTTLTRYLGWLTGDFKNAEDIAQNILTKIYQEPQLFDVKANFKTWIFAIAKNQWKNDLRNQANRKKHQLDIQLHQISQKSDQADNYQIQLQVLKEAIKNLSESHKEVFVLKYSNNLTIKEISVICECSEGTVKSRLFYATSQLRQAINKLK